MCLFGKSDLPHLANDVSQQCAKWDLKARKYVILRRSEEVLIFLYTFTPGRVLYQINNIACLQDVKQQPKCCSQEQ